MPLRPHSLIEAHDSILLVVDVQSYFLDKVDSDRRAIVLANIGCLIRVARWSGVPVLATAEEYDRLPLAPEIAGLLSGIDPVFDKHTFGLADQLDIAEAVAATGRQTAVVVGLETDVCVLHSALGLLDRGYRVVVVADAVASPGAHHQIGLERLRAAGAVIADRKGLFYEWLRTVDAVARFHADEPTVRAMIGDDW